MSGVERARSSSVQPGRIRGDGGQVAGMEAIPFGMLIFVVGSLLVANAWAVIDAKITVSAASREAARSYVEAPDQISAAARADAAARGAVESHGRNPDRAVLRVDHENGSPWGRCIRVLVTVRYPVPALTLPWIGGYGHAFDVRSTHSEIIDPFRGGLPGEGTC